MDITRIGRNPATDPQKARASQISVHNGTVYFAATPNRPFAGGASVAQQTREVLARVDERLALAGSDKSRILIVQVWISDMRHFAEMNSVWDEWVDQASPPARACAACDLGHPDLKVEVIVTAAVR
jgi:enamine deaminase RidA (YjgF/YER057c/UK114 family)